MVKIKYKKISDGMEKLAKPEMNSSRLGVGFEERVKEFYFINIKNLLPYKEQARLYFNEEEIVNLALSVKKHGIRQPLTILPCNKMKGKYEVISGERRLKAARIAGLEKVPCIIIQDRNVAQEVSIIENIHREDLHPIELGNAFKFLLDKNYFKSQNSIARNLAINESTVSECIKYTKIPEVVKSYLIKQNIKSRDKLRKILKFKNNHDEINNYLGINNIKIINKNFSVMRINLYNKKLKFQLNGINRLPNEQKIILQNKLKEIVKEIDEIESFK